MSHHEVDGKLKQIKGRVKEATGIVTGNSKLERAGIRDRAKGAVEEAVGKARDKAEELVDKATKASKK